MKTIKKIGILALMSIAAMVFFGCSDTEDDEDLEVTITNSGNLITLTVPEDYKNAHIVYTLDGSEPKLTYNKDAYTSSNESVAEYVDYGTAALYEEAFTIGETTTIKAVGFQVNVETGKLAVGPVATKKVPIAANENTSGNTAAVSQTIPSSAVTFKLASTANTYTTKYFDTSSTNVFKYGDKNAYYQTQFSWKGKGKGNWYLYMREVGGGMIKNGNDNFIAKGTYTGTTFDNTSSATAINTGTTLKLLNDKGSTGNEITVDTDNKFELKVNGVESASISSGGVYVGDAK